MSGSLPDHDVLLRLADLMDADDVRTHRVGIPASYGQHLLWTALTGPGDSWSREYVRRLRAEGPEAVKTWADRLEVQQYRLIELVYPGGAIARPRSADEVRTMAAEAVR